MRTVRPLRLAAAALLSACNAAGSSEPAAQPVAGPVRLIHHHPAPDAPLQAVVKGTLRVDDKGCLRLRDQLVVWPEAAALDLTKPGVVRVFHREDSASVQVGQNVTLLVTAASKATAAPSCPGSQLSVARFSPAA